MKNIFYLFVVTTLVGTTGCSSDSGPNRSQSSFEVRYEGTGTCNGSLLSNNGISVAYTTDGGGTAGGIEVLPFTFGTTINVSSPNTAVAFAVDCPGSGSTNNTVKADIFVDGELKATNSATGSDTIIATAAFVLNPQF